MSNDLYRATQYQYIYHTYKVVQYSIHTHMRELWQILQLIYLQRDVINHHTRLKSKHSKLPLTRKINTHFICHKICTIYNHIICFCYYLLEGLKDFPVPSVVLFIMYGSKICLNGVY